MIQNTEKSCWIKPKLFLFCLSLSLWAFSLSVSALPPCMFWSVGLFPRVLALSWPHAFSVSLSLSVFHVLLSQNFIR